MAIVNIGKENIVDLLSDARELRNKYGIKENEYPNTFTYFGNRYRNLDQLAWEMFERKEGFITTGIKLDRDDIRIYGRIAMISSDGYVFADNETVTYRLINFIEGTTVSTLASEICNVVWDRAKNGNGDIKNLMVGNLNQVAHTKQVVGNYVYRNNYVS